MSYCSLGTKATVNIASPIQEKIIIDAPINVAVVASASGRYQDYTHDMSQPIDKTFDKSITSIILNDPVNDYVYSGEYPPSNPIVHRTCPVPSIQDNKIYLDFDPGAYADNVGTCTYRVFFGGFTLTASNSAGQSITRKYDAKPVFTVACGDDCPEGFCKCIIPEYPGYCCLDCSATAASIHAITNQLRGKNG